MDKKILYWALGLNTAFLGILAISSVVVAYNVNGVIEHYRDNWDSKRNKWYLKTDFDGSVEIHGSVDIDGDVSVRNPTDRYDNKIPFEMRVR